MQHTLQEIKKELKHLNATDLAEICLRMSKYKKENKELISYLLFDASDPMQFAETVKSELKVEFENINKHYYYSVKSLRKILRLLNRYAKYTADKQVETELLLWFAGNFLIYTDTRSSHKPLRLIFTRQLEKIKKVIAKLPEDLQFDYSQEYELLLDNAQNNLKSFYKKDFML
ncbi:hypothetical protein GS399_15685 [Pedobacter sp. HMF7647]|uniref:Uncharacterized protein n=1 Tax=Hufsiella arboris TaxID=2695275 RepID=A0A7K1YCV8_9SPHI|nr:hypothetical protein [Hufsiella arboris]MXV52416.1 hypothetical protein [Hufsiella arboris]